MKIGDVVQIYTTEECASEIKRYNYKFAIINDIFNCGKSEPKVDYELRELKTGTIIPFIFKGKWLRINNNRKVCEHCGEKFTPLSVNQRFCSVKCQKKKWRKNVGKYERFKNDEERQEYERRKKEYRLKNYPQIEFDCAYCGRKVITDTETTDMRTTFCSPECEKAYWRHPAYESESFRQNFEDIRRLASWERKTNEREYGYED